MRDRMPFQLELAGESATLYLHGRLDRDSHTAMLAACTALPLSVRTLRLDLRAIGVMTAEATSAVRLLLAQWCDGGRGEFRLSTSHLMAVCTRVLGSTDGRKVSENTTPKESRHALALAPL
jgi:ABC-type transporter Mla MlaB component